MLSNDRPIGVIQVEVAGKFFWGWLARELPVPGALFSGQKFDWHTVPAPLLLAKLLSFATLLDSLTFLGFCICKSQAQKGIVLPGVLRSLKRKRHEDWLCAGLYPRPTPRSA